MIPHPDERAGGRKNRRVEEERQCARACSLACVTDKWQETNREPVPWLMFVRSLGAGAAAAIFEIQLCTKIAPLLRQMSDFCVDGELDTDVVTR